MSARMEKRVLEARPACSEVRMSKGEAKRGMDKGKEAHESAPARKAAKYYELPVPQTDTGRREENSKTNGRTLVKELGKMTP